MTQNAWNTQYPDANGELLIGSGSGRALAATLTAGTNVTINNSAGGIEIQTAPIDDLVVVHRATASSSSSIDFECRLSDFHCLIITGNEVQGATDEVGFGVQVGTGSPVSYDTTEANYTEIGWTVDDTSGIAHTNTPSAAGAKLQIYGNTENNAGNATNETCSFVAWLSNPSSTNFTKMTAYSVFVNSTGEFTEEFHASLHRTAAAVTGIRLKQTSGNIAQGDIVIYGAVK